MDRWRIEVLDAERDPVFDPREDLKRIAVTLAILGLVASSVVASPARHPRPDTLFAVSVPRGPASANGLLSILPAGWEVQVVEDLLVAAPTAWGAPRAAGPDPSGLSSIFEFASGDALVMQWRGSDIASLRRRSSIQAEHAPGLIVRDLDYDRGGIEVLMDAQTWCGPGGCGTYQSRALFVPATAERVVQVAVQGERRAGAHGVLRDDQIGEQMLVARFVRILADAERAFTHAQVEQALAGIRPALLRIASGPVREVTRGHEAVYWAGGPARFVYVATYPDVASRLRDDPNHGASRHRAAGALAAVTYRGIGNVLVIAGGDADFRYRVITALDALVP